MSDICFVCSNKLKMSYTKCIFVFFSAIVRKIKSEWWWFWYAPASLPAPFEGYEMILIKYIEENKESLNSPIK